MAVLQPILNGIGWPEYERLRFVCLNCYDWLFCFTDLQKRVFAKKLCDLYSSAMPNMSKPFVNIDQAPFHRNEAGSAATSTLAIMGAHTVPLVENHAATRQRCSLTTVTDSNGQTRIKRWQRSAHAAEKRAAIAHARGWGDRGNGGTGLQLELLRWWQRWRNAYTTPAIRREEASRMLAQALDNGAGQ